jgi:hypothetical protein
VRDPFNGKARIDFLEYGLTFRQNVLLYIVIDNNVVSGSHQGVR